jgi:hypothetical protein
LNPQRTSGNQAAHELDSNLVAGIALANSNELQDISSAITYYSNRVMRVELCPTNLDLASNQLSAAIDGNVIELAHDIHFYEQGARARRCTVSNQVLAEKLAWFYTNSTPAVEHTISNDSVGICTNLMIQLYGARNDDLIASGLRQAVLLLERMSNDAAIEKSSAIKPSKYQPARPRAASGRQSVEGVPADVYAGIRASAASRWPNNYDMQVFVIDQQCAAYRKLNP